ncbi:MAG TPA: TonB-dependent receptor [Candidatus Deferrimicrobiaceae bacterium]|nr:TonB-dependent receptor [Candidatus Deferrimicrobiaceae bacterium]
MPFVVALFFLSSTSFVASAQPDQSGNPLKGLSLAELGNVEVTTASKEPEEVWKTTAAVYVITHDDIERSGATSIPEALRLAPGVEVARIDSSKWSIGIRGFGSRLCRDVLVMIDGRTVYTTLIAGTYWEVQDYVLEDIDRIEVIRGPGGTIWGPNALNGVINIITKNSRETHGDYVSVGGGNVEEGFFNARYGGGDGKTLDYRMYAKGFNRGPEYHSDNINFDRWRAAQVGFRMDWSANKRDTFSLHVDMYDQGNGESVHVTSYAPPYSQIVYSTAPLFGANLTGQWKRAFSEGNDIQLEAYYDRTNRQEADFSDIRNTLDVDFLDRVRLPGRQEISWGLGARSSRGDDRVVTSGLAFVPYNRTDLLFTAFLQDDIALIANKLSLSVGTKALKTNYTGVQFEPTGRLLWTPTLHQTVWAAFTHALRTPSDGERDFYLLGDTGSVVDGLPVLARFNANPNFHSEELNGYEAGYRRLIGKNLYVDVAAFYNHYGDLFSEDVTGGPFLETIPGPPHILIPAEFGNGLVGTTKGGEIAPAWKVTDWWRLQASYSYLQMDLKKGTGSMDIGTAPIVEKSSPKHEVMIQSAFDLSKAFSLDLDYRYISALLGESGLPGQTVPSYSTADAQFAWKVKEHWQLSVVGRNLFRPYHYESNGDPGPLVGIKRSAYGQITWTR